MSDPYIGEIRMFGGNFAPLGWAFCNGALIPISENEALFNLIGTTYGGDGQNTFALPNLLSRAPVHMGRDNFGNTYVIGQPGGIENVTLAIGQMPLHSHTLAATTAGTSVASPTNALPGMLQSDQSGVMLYGNGTAMPTNLRAASISPSGNNQPHNNVQPYLAVNFIISLFGIYPSQN